MFDLDTAIYRPNVSFFTYVGQTYKLLRPIVDWTMERNGEPANGQCCDWGVNPKIIRLIAGQWWHGYFQEGYGNIVYPHVEDHTLPTTNRVRLFMFRDETAAFEFRLRWC